MRILLIDDDEQLMEVLADKLIKQRYAVDIANTGEMGWEFILLFEFDLLVLDWMLPDIDGLTLCQQIRAKGYQMPIMLLTARDRYNDKVSGLDAGADDYVVKPFNFDELTARIRALLRREIGVTAPILAWEGLNLDPKTHEVHYHQQLLHLTPKEYGLIELLMRHPQQVFSPTAIINNLWAGEDPPGEEAVRTHIKGLRHKLKAVGLEKDTIKTVYGVGYRLKSEEDRQESLRPSKISTQSGSERSAIINQIWSKFSNLAFQRVSDIEKLMLDASATDLNLKVKSQAQNSAHKLAGSLGCFGFPEGSKIAKQIELILVNETINSENLAKIGKLSASLRAELTHQKSETTVKDTLGKNISLLIIDRDRHSKLSQQLEIAARQQGMITYIVSELSQAYPLIQQESLTAVLYKIVFPDGQDLEFLEQLHQQSPQLPIIAIAQDAQLPDRLDLVRKGGNLILPYPIDPQVAIASVAELIENLGAAAKVLIVDDDPQILMSLEVSLAPWGFDVTTLDCPKSFWSVLEDLEPDILLLDIEMPDINGIELCQILRSDRRWQHLPVLFLTAHQDEKTQYQAFAIGADDYITKPVTTSILANRILNRLRRSRS